MKTLESSPKIDGFQMPGEFSPHRGTYMLWPQRTDNWRRGAKPAQRAFVEVASAISKFEKLTMGVSAEQYSNAAYLLPDQIKVVEIGNDDSWIRDCGPTFVINEEGEIRGVDWTFNAWGGLVDGLYFPWDKDEQVAKKVCEIEEAPRYKLRDFVLEGGSIHVDGEGTLYTTRECLLSEGRNPQLSQEQIEKVLMEYTGVEKIIWLNNGIYLDETNGHVDNILNVVKPGEVVLAWTENKDDPQYEICIENFEILSKTKDARGRDLIIHKLLLPEPILISEEESLDVDSVEGTLPRQAGDRLAASYVNYYCANGGIIYPMFNDPMDIKAKELLSSIYPDREIVGVYAREILLGGGNIHCITQQIPK